MHSSGLAGLARDQATYLSVSGRQLVRRCQSRASFGRCTFSHFCSVSLSLASPKASSLASRLRFSVDSSCSSAASRGGLGSAALLPAPLASDTTNPRRFCRSCSLASWTSHPVSISQYLSTSHGRASKSRASKRSWARAVSKSSPGFLSERRFRRHAEFRRSPLLSQAGLLSCPFEMSNVHERSPRDVSLDYHRCVIFMRSQTLGVTSDQSLAWAL